MTGIDQAASQPAELRRRRTDGYLPVEYYAAIGDGRTLALVGADGSIDWMCLPNLDSPSVFAALLDPAGGGSFSCAPAVGYEMTRSYVEETNVLQSEFTTAEGAVRVTDAMTIDSSQIAPWRELVRRVEGLSGTVPMQWRLRPRFDYGQRSRDPVRRDDALVYEHGGLQLALSRFQAGEAEIEDGAVKGGFELAQGQTATLALTAGDGVALPTPPLADLERRLQSTIEHWRGWVGHTRYEGPWTEAVKRSLLAIRLLTGTRAGAIAAAGTTSLPEVIGGERNYDYRFGWVRDLSFAVEALLRMGMNELAHTSVEWLLQAVGRTRPRVDPVYALTGEVVRSQQQLQLPGYRASAPVHLGNQAGSQLQLGGFGDLLETIWSYANRGHVLASSTGVRLADAADLLSSIWHNQDAGLWELSDYAHYATSKIGCWTAFERLLDLARQRQVPTRNVGRWQAERDRIREFVETRLWSDGRGSYVMKAGSEMLDCGVLLAARREFTDPRGPRMNGTIDAIGSELHAGGPLLYRYSGMQDEENAFLACSFWMVEALALAGRRDQAAEMMEGMVSLANDVGLYSEEMDPGTHAMLGNFPQTLTHLALINAAALLAETPQAGGRPTRLPLSER
jgi:GH15 family glucan-1,4-alpha-glucosidase